jgi:hypothetical protein
MLNEAMKDDITVDCGLSSSLFIYNVHFQLTSKANKKSDAGKKFCVYTAGIGWF